MEKEMHFLNKILNIGTYSKSDADVKKIRILNGIAFFSALVLIFNGIVIFIGSYPFEKFTFRELFEYLMASPEIKVSEVQKFRIIFPLLDFILASFAIMALLFNYFRKYKISVLLICLIANFYIAFFYWVSGYFSVFFFFIPALLPLIFYQRAKQYFPFLLATLTIFVVLTIIKYNKSIDDLFMQPPADKALLNSLLNFSAVFIMLYFIILHFKKENIKNEEMLKENNKVLDKQSKEIRLQRDELHEKNNKLSTSEKELKELNATKDKFISILAHDLRTPFNSLIGFSDLLLENFREYDEDKIESLLKSINKASNTTYQLLDQILLWANSQAGKLTIKTEEFSFTNATKDLIAEIENLATQKNIKISLFEAERIFLTADLNMFKTVMRNLITNAIKFSHQNGQINIFAEIIDQNITITVSDNGIGIDEKVIPRLWEIKENYSSVGTENEKGTGFGLKLCKELINKHGGEIWVESKVGKGSKFRFTMPFPNK